MENEIDPLKEIIAQRYLEQQSLQMLDGNTKKIQPALSDEIAILQRQINILKLQQIDPKIEAMKEQQLAIAVRRHMRDSTLNKNMVNLFWDCNRSCNPALTGT